MVNLSTFHEYLSSETLQKIFNKTEVPGMQTANAKQTESLGREWNVPKNRYANLCEPEPF